MPELRHAGNIGSLAFSMANTKAVLIFVSLDLQHFLCLHQTKITEEGMHFSSFMFCLMVIAMFVVVCLFPEIF